MKTRPMVGLAALGLLLGIAAWVPFGAGSSAIATAEAASGAPDLEDLLGGRATAGAAAFRARGFVVAKPRGLTTHWWHGGSQRCVRSVTAQGLYRSVESVSAAQCGM